MMAAILNSAILDSVTAILDSDTFLSSLRFTQNTLPPLWLWLKLIQSDSNSFILTQLDYGTHLGFCHHEFGHLGISHLSFSSQTHSHLPRLVPTICTKKTLIHSFWLNVMMVAILNSSILDSASGILDSDTLLSSLRFTQKHSHSTLTLTQTNSNWLKLIHSHSTWWWQPSWILPSQIRTLQCWIQTPCYLLPDSLKNTLPALWLWP